MPELQQVVLGSFRLLGVLGTGSFATAYVAEQVGMDRKAVVKIAHPHLVHSGQGKMVRDRFASEVRAATRVNHPNLVTIYTAGETDDGLPALAMEYLEGETLGQRLGRGERLSFDELHRGFAQLASALARVHASRIIHRDVSPANVFLSQGPEGFAMKLLDFGIARLQDLATGSNYTMMGTPFYVALEQLRGKATPASDVYSVGALLWWSLTGEELYPHVTEFTQLLYVLETQREPPDACMVCPTMPMEIGTLVGSMLHQDALQRPTMVNFVERWAMLEPELREFWAARDNRHVGVLMAEGRAQETLIRSLQREGHSVVALEPRVSSVLSQPMLDVVVVDAELSEPDPLALSRHLTHVLPDVRQCAVSTRPFASAWLAEPVHLHALLPEQLPALKHAIAHDLPNGARAFGSGEFARRALGEIPELLARLEESVANDNRGSAIAQCELLERIAHLAMLEEMGSLARTLRVLWEQDAVDEPAGFVEQLTRSFRESFAGLLAAQENG